MIISSYYDTGDGNTSSRRFENPEFLYNDENGSDVEGTLTLFSVFGFIQSISVGLIVAIFLIQNTPILAKRVWDRN